LGTRREARADIAVWLRGLGLQQYEQAFHDNAIDAAVLPDLTAEDLKELGVKSGCAFEAGLACDPLD
jgi:hypothetical protein